MWHPLQSMQWGRPFFHDTVVQTTFDGAVKCLPPPCDHVYRQVFQPRSEQMVGELQNVLRFGETIPPEMSVSMHSMRCIPGDCLARCPLSARGFQIPLCKRSERKFVIRFAEEMPSSGSGDRKRIGAQNRIRIVEVSAGRDCFNDLEPGRPE